VTAWLRDLIATWKAALIASNDREHLGRDALARATEAGRRQAAAQIAREILAVAPRPHQPGAGCGGPARCPECATAAQAWRLAEIAGLTGAQR
jgi:hypothetical protein